jgi:hypothetical protein
VESRPSVVSDDPGTSFVTNLSGDGRWLAWNHEDVGVIYDAQQQHGIAVSNREANNRAVVAGCFAFWVTGSTSKPAGHTTRLC